MDENLVKKLVKVVEEYINELDDETVNAVSDKRKEKAKQAQQEFVKTIRDMSKSGDEVEKSALKKLEKSLKESFVSEACIKDILSLVEGELINFQEKRKQKVLDRNAIKMAKMMQDGSLNAVRVLPNNELIGDPTAIKMVKDIQKENADVINAARKKAKTNNG